MHLPARIGGVTSPTQIEGRDDVQVPVSSILPLIPQLRCQKSITNRSSVVCYQPLRLTTPHFTSTPSRLRRGTGFSSCVLFPFLSRHMGPDQPRQSVGP